MGGNEGGREGGRKEGKEFRREGGEREWEGMKDGGRERGREEGGREGSKMGGKDERTEKGKNVSVNTRNSYAAEERRKVIRNKFLSCMQNIHRVKKFLFPSIISSPLLVYPLSYPLLSSPLLCPISSPELSR